MNTKLLTCGLFLLSCKCIGMNTSVDVMDLNSHIIRVMEGRGFNPARQIAAQAIISSDHRIRAHAIMLYAELARHKKDIMIAYSVLCQFENSIWDEEISACIRLRKVIEMLQKEEKA
jgi:hypothetical protein